MVWRKYRRNKKSQPLGISDVLKAWVKSKGLQQEFSQYTVLARWPAVVGERLAARTRPMKMEKGVLTVAVATSAWLNELNFMRGDLVARINQELGQGSVVGIRLVLGDVPLQDPAENDEVDAESPPSAERAPVEVPEEVQAAVDQLIKESVADEDLRRAIREARLAQYRGLENDTIGEEC